jgi:hypothetical protein
MSWLYAPVSVWWIPAAAFIGPLVGAVLGLIILRRLRSREGPYTAEHPMCGYRGRPQRTIAQATWDLDRHRCVRRP